MTSDGNNFHHIPENQRNKFSGFNNTGKLKVYFNAEKREILMTQRVSARWLQKCGIPQGMEVCIPHPHFFSGNLFPESVPTPTHKNVPFSHSYRRQKGTY